MIACLVANGLVLIHLPLLGTGLENTSAKCSTRGHDPDKAMSICFSLPTATLCVNRIYNQTAGVSTKTTAQLLIRLSFFLTGILRSMSLGYYVINDAQILPEL